MFDQLLQFWPYVAALLDVVIAIVASAHAVLYKRDTRAAIGWVGLVWLAPLVGAVLYAWLGINRIKRRARSLRSNRPRGDSYAGVRPCPAELLDETRGPGGTHLNSLAKLVGEVTRRPLLEGNRIVPLVNGDQAYPAMIEAIDVAARSVTLSTYIFDNDQAGRLFFDALQRAAARGVAVRVLIDDVGSRYTWPAMARQLRVAGLTAVKFLPTLIPWRFQYANLRNHRKIIVVDGRVGFTGGINIRAGHCLGWQPSHPVQDLHFRVTGPVVTQLQDVFADDWAFCTGEVLDGDPWFVGVDPDGAALARAIPDGPDDNFENLRLVLLGAIAAARSSIAVVTPYFLPDAALITSLNVAAMRGVQVDIVLPEQNNLSLVKWASTALLWQLLERGCRVWLSPPPFDHSKLMLVDGCWSLVGSANWDPRSLRLNFEFNVECYDRELAAALNQLTEGKLAQARPVTLAEVDGRSLPIRLRDGVARLFSPYL